MLDVQKIYKTFNPGTVNEKRALNGLSLQLAEGDFVTVIGTAGFPAPGCDDAIAHGNRLIMMHEGKIILDIYGEEKKKLTVEDLLHQFEKVSGEEFASDKALLS